MTPEELERVRTRIKELPSDWWRHASACAKFPELFCRHMLALHLLYEKGGRLEQELFTGFYLHHRDRAMWATAGHVIKVLQELRNNASIKIKRTRWLDGFQMKDAASIPDDLHELNFFSTYQDDQDMDFGVASLDNVFMTLRGNPNLVPITEVGWLNYETAKPDGYYIVGYPDESWKGESWIHHHGHEYFIKLVANLACLPAERIEPRANVDPHEFWERPTSFYGQLLSLPDDLEVRDIVGVSGGPVLSIERTGDGDLKYRMVGIQSGWLKSRRIVRAESMADIEAVMRPI